MRRSAIIHLLVGIILLLLTSNILANEWSGGLIHPGNSGFHLMVSRPGERLVFGSGTTGIYLYDIQDSTWTFPSYGDGCNGGIFRVSDLASVRARSDTLYATTYWGQAVGWGRPFPALLRSVDGGLSWQSIDTIRAQLYQDVSNVVATDPFHPGTVFWGGERWDDNIGWLTVPAMRTLDYGQNWEGMPGRSRGGAVTAIEFSDQRINRILYGSLGVVWNDSTVITSLEPLSLSEDGGETWKRVYPLNPIVGTQSPIVSAIAEDPFDPSKWICALQEATTFNSHIIASTDSGHTWNEIGTFNFVFNTLIADPERQGTYWAIPMYYGFPLRSEDHGISWTPDSSGLELWNPFYEDITIDPATGYVYLVSRNGPLFVKESLSSAWRALPNNPFDNVVPWSATISGDTLSFIANMRIYRSKLPPVWNPVECGPDAKVWALAADLEHPNWLVTTSNYNPDVLEGKIEVSKDFGSTWEQWGIDPNVFQDDPIRFYFLHPDTLLAIGEWLGHSAKVWKDGMQMINSQYVGPMGKMVKYNNQLIVFLNDKLISSSDLGKSWSELLGSSVRSFVSREMNSPYFLAATGKREINYSGDGGDSWQLLSDLPDGIQICPIHVTEDSVVIVNRWMTSMLDWDLMARKGTSGEWISIRYGLPAEAQGAARMYSNDQYIVVWLNGIPGKPNLYWQPLDQLMSVDGGGWQALPTSFSLDAPYPNPFNGTTSVKVVVPHRDRVKVTVHNMLGQMVTTLADGIMEPGVHRLTWNANGLASGTYIVTLKAPGTAPIARTVTLVK